MLIISKKFLKIAIDIQKIINIVVIVCHFDDIPNLPARRGV
jgi:hypothetical protein